MGLPEVAEESCASVSALKQVFFFYKQVLTGVAEPAPEVRCPGADSD